MVDLRQKIIAVVVPLGDRLLSSFTRMKRISWVEFGATDNQICKDARKVVAD